VPFLLDESTGGLRTTWRTKRGDPLRTNGEKSQVEDFLDHIPRKKSFTVPPGELFKA